MGGNEGFDIVTYSKTQIWYFIRHDLTYDLT